MPLPVLAVSSSSAGAFATLSRITSLEERTFLRGPALVFRLIRSKSICTASNPISLTGWAIVVSAGRVIAEKYIVCTNNRNVLRHAESCFACSAQSHYGAEVVQRDDGGGSKLPRAADQAVEGIHGSRQCLVRSFEGQIASLEAESSGDLQEVILPWVDLVLSQSTDESDAGVPEFLEVKKGLPRAILEIHRHLIDRQRVPDIRTDDHYGKSMLKFTLEDLAVNVRINEAGDDAVDMPVENGVEALLLAA